MAGLKKTSGKVSYGAPGNNANSRNTKKRVRGQAKKRSRAQGKAAARNETNNDLVTCPECGTTYSERRHSGICPDCKGKSESVRPQIRNEVTKMTNADFQKHQYKHIGKDGKKYILTQDKTGTVLDPVEIVGEGRQAIREVIKSEIYNMVARNLMAEEVIREGKEGRIINFLATRGIPKNDMSFSGGVLTFDKGMQQASKAKSALISKQSPLNATGKKGLRQEYGKLMWIVPGHTGGSNSSNITDKVVGQGL